MSKLRICLGKLFSWFTVLFCRSGFLLEQTASLFFLGLRKACLILELITWGQGIRLTSDVTTNPVKLSSRRAETKTQSLRKP